ncbi:hypothetical protein V1293_005259 [Bradyrhizobium sp. AZCC 1693]
MLVVEMIAKIRRAYFVHGQPIKAICVTSAFREGGTEGHPFGGDGVWLRARGTAASENQVSLLIEMAPTAPAAIR